MGPRGVALAVACCLVTWVSGEERHHHHHNCVHDRIVRSKARAKPPQVPYSRRGTAEAETSHPLRIRYHFVTGRESESGCEAAGERVSCSCHSRGQRTFSPDRGAPESCPQSSTLQAREEEIIRTSLDAAAAKLGSMLRLPGEAAERGMPLGAGLCGLGETAGVVIPAEHATEGPLGADFVAYVIATPSGTHPEQEESTYIAWAASCRVNSDGRPVAGIINFNPEMLRSGHIGVDAAATTATHELMHALGFSSETFVNGMQQRIERGTRAVITSPKALAKAREHFGCGTLSGVALENDGGEGTAGSHWDKQVMGTEAMTGVLSSGEHEYVSAITLATFEDMGWYRADYSSLRGFAWGKDKGCGLPALTGCDRLSDPGPEFCFPDDPVGERRAGVPQRCSTDRVNVGFCGVTRYERPLPHSKRYFTDPTLGGMFESADYCPSTLSMYSCIDPLPECGAFSTKDGCAQDNRCQWHEAAAHCLAAAVADGSDFGSSSRCFTGSEAAGLRRKQRQNDEAKLGARCFDVDCTPQDHYRVRIGGRDWIKCPLQGGTGEWDDPVGSAKKWMGMLDCPTRQAICGVSPPPSATSIAHSADSAAVATPPPTPRPRGRDLGECPWRQTSGKEGVLECMDGTECYVIDQGWGCCQDAGGRARCPTDMPVMCSQGGVQRCGQDHCCVASAETCELSATHGSQRQIEAVRNEVSFQDEEGYTNTLRMESSTLLWEVCFPRAGGGCDSEVVSVGPIGWDPSTCVIFDSVVMSRAEHNVDCTKIKAAVLLEEGMGGVRPCPSGVEGTAADALSDPKPTVHQSGGTEQGQRTLSGCACRREWSCLSCLSGALSEGGPLKPCTHGCCNPDDDEMGAWCMVEDPSCEGSQYGYCVPEGAALAAARLLLSHNNTGEEEVVRKDDHHWVFTHSGIRLLRVLAFAAGGAVIVAVLLRFGRRGPSSKGIAFTLPGAPGPRQLVDGTWICDTCATYNTTRVCAVCAIPGPNP
eukprot:Hpha_TRINITY_DN8036_c0_g2::TRINITY_DN8036_c0_g2_i1::g.140158::m.140158